jgi:hypothetical protein
MKRDRFQIDTSSDIRERAKEVARRRGMKLGPFVHRLLAEEDPELARLIAEQLGLGVERR